MAAFQMIRAARLMPCSAPLASMCRGFAAPAFRPALALNDNSTKASKMPVQVSLTEPLSKRNAGVSVREMMLYSATVKAKPEATDTLEAIAASKKAVDDGSMGSKLAPLKVKQFELWEEGECWNFYIIHESKDSFEASWAGRDKHPLFQALAKDTSDTLEHPSSAEHQAMVMESVFQYPKTNDPIEGASKGFIEIHVKDGKAEEFSQKVEEFFAANKDGISQFDLGKDGDRRGYSKKKLDEGPKKLAEGSKIWGIYAQATQATMDALKAMLKAEKTDLGLTYYDGQEA